MQVASYWGYLKVASKMNTTADLAANSSLPFFLTFPDLARKSSSPCKCKRPYQAHVKPNPKPKPKPNQSPLPSATQPIPFPL